MILDDYNRVVLEQIDNIPDSDYINASYVDVSAIFYEVTCKISNNLKYVLGSTNMFFLKMNFFNNKNLKNLIGKFWKSMEKF